MYLTKDIYYKKRAIDLEIEFKSGRYDNPSNAVNVFLQKTEDWMLEYLFANYNTKQDELDPDIMQQAMIYQVDFELENGTLHNDIDNSSKALAPAAYQILRSHGYCNLQTNGSRPYNFGVRK